MAGGEDGWVRLRLEWSREGGEVGRRGGVGQGRRGRWVGQVEIGVEQGKVTRWGEEEEWARAGGEDGWVRLR